MPTQVAAAQRDPGQQQPGIDRVVEPRHAVDRLEHQIAGVEGQHDLVVALGAELLAQELAVAGRVLPVDEAAVEPGRVLAQRLELGAVARLLLDLDAVDRVLARRTAAPCCARRARWAARRCVRSTADAPAELDEPERPAPAQPDALDRRPGRAAAARRATSAARSGRRAPAAPRRSRPARPRRAARRSARSAWPRRHRVAAMRDRRSRRARRYRARPGRDRDVEQPRRERQQGVDAGDEQRPARRRSNDERPQARIVDHARTSASGMPQAKSSTARRVGRHRMLSRRRRLVEDLARIAVGGEPLDLGARATA